MTSEAQVKDDAGQGAVERDSGSLVTWPAERDLRPARTQGSAPPVRGSEDDRAGRSIDPMTPSPSHGRREQQPLRPVVMGAPEAVDGWGAAHRVAVLALDSVLSYELLTVLEVFDAANTVSGRRLYDVRVVTTGSVASTVTTHGAGSWQLPAAPISAAADAATVVVPGHCAYRRQPPVPVMGMLHAAHARGARIAAFGTGAFLVAATGVLDGRAVTTHWSRTAELASTYPRLRVRPELLYVRDGQHYTGAGGATAVDLALRLVEQHHGPLLTSWIAARLVAPDLREGTHPQRRLVLHDHPDPLGATMDWALAHLGAGLRVDDLAHHAHLSRRTFDRHFRARTGEAPLGWLVRHQLRRAQELLHHTTWPLDRVARASGFHTQDSLRHHFTRGVGQTPGAYRRTPLAASGEDPGPQEGRGGGPAPGHDDGRNAA